ncbi:hypothetical protein WNZ14_22200 [Hoeflea sp. AS60]|uniref:hypothetical protein n=1 Tax=Hoeflea sp. AS60 TaxID=3135780 RepID=UPI00316BD241
MNRFMTFTLALFLSLSALAHSFDAVDIVYDCESTIDLVECSSSVANGALGSDPVPLGEETEIKKSVHCQMHCAIFAEFAVSTITVETGEHATVFKALLLSKVGYLVPRPPNAHG